MSQSELQAEPICAHAACTIVSPNYLPYARTVAASYLAQHPGHRFFVLIVADIADKAVFAHEPFTTVMLHEIGVPDLRSIAMRYEILELNTNVKPAFLKHLLRQFHIEVLTYLDPDIFVYAPLTPVFDALKEEDVVLTPHLTSPLDDGKLPGEQEMLYNGTYNLGFIAVRNSPNTLRILNWWERRCLDLGYSEGRTGLFVDQKWMNLAPGMFEKVATLRHPGCNMAYWNLNDRVLSGSSIAPVINERVPLCFFHFSGLVLDDPESLSRNTNRFTLASRPDLAGIFTRYRAAIAASRDDSLERLPYGFDTFSDGTRITRLARRLYAAHLSRFGAGDPFHAEGAFYRFASSSGLLAGKLKPPQATWSEFSDKDRRVEAVHTLLRLTLKLLGANRYELLMRYLAHISVLRNQGAFIGPRS